MFYCCRCALVSPLCVHDNFGISLGKEPQLLGEAFKLLTVRDLSMMSMMFKSTAIILC